MAKQVTCPKGAMLWTHRAMMVALLCLVVGLPILVGSNMEQDQQTKQDMATSGSWLIIVWAILMFGCMVNAFARGCWRTGLVAFFL
jgi:hypothetical protein